MHCRIFRSATLSSRSSITQHPIVAQRLLIPLVNRFDSLSSSLCRRLMSGSSPAQSGAVAPSPSVAVSPQKTEAAHAAAQSAALGVQQTIGNTHSKQQAVNGAPGAASAAALATGALDTQNQPTQVSADAAAAAAATAAASGKPPKGKGKKGKKDSQSSVDGSAAADGTEKAAHQRPAEWIMPEFIKQRIALWDELYAQQQAQIAQLPHTPITVTLPDGKTLAGTSHTTTPLELAKQLSNSLAERIVIAKVNGKTWDLTRPLVEDCSLELCDFSHPDGQFTFWHSSAHVLGQAMEHAFPEARLGVGPPIADGGFYYDVSFGKDGEGVLTPDNFSQIDKLAERVQKDKQPFERLHLTPAQARQMFADNAFKQEIIGKIPPGGEITAYRCGPLIDLCRGPHLPHTGLIKAFAVLKNSSAYWMGRADQAQMQRIYAISFPDKTRMKEWRELVKQAELRDHRRIGKEQKLFFFDELSPGSAFFLPHGARIYNTLIQFIRSQYHKRGYSEVHTPNVYNLDLWKRSGHYDNYKDNMFVFEVEKAQFGMKPMNCPGHCVMFGSEQKSYRDLPLRLADFGVLHRNEISGALTGLTRVRRFQQDDAHIFCRDDQIQHEVSGVLDMLQEVYAIFGFSFTLMLSTRPEKYLGQISTWDRAEAQLRACLDAFVARPACPITKWELNPGDGAFYGPKIDIQLTDALRRKHQCATIQLDFQLPERFKLQYKDSEGGMSQPVMIHRAILGSVERMIAVLCEHTGGKWPLWISPRQVCVIPVAETYADYAREVTQQLHDANLHADCDDSSDQLKQKIRKATLKQYNLICVVGEKEVAAKSVNVRRREDPEHPTEVPVAEFLASTLDQIKNHK